jgi:DNA-binding beta-propeller fold protein YncE
MGPRKTLASATLLTLAALALVSSSAEGRKVPIESFDQMVIEEPMMHGLNFGIAQFRLDGLPLGSNGAPSVTPHAGSHGGTVAVDEHGVLTLDRELGKLIRSTREGKQLASLDFERGAGELVRDGGSDRVYVADRRADRIVKVRAGARSLERLDGAKLREPHGLALSPDGKTLYATSVADHELVAFDTETMHPRWRVELAPEPRGVAVSADGKHAVVGFLTTGALARIELGTSPMVEYVSLDPGHRAGVDPFAPFIGEIPQQANVDVRSPGVGGVSGAASLADTQNVGLRFARNTYALAYVGNDLAVAPHQLSTPHLPSAGFEDTGSYGGGGGFTAPIIHRMAMVDGEQSFAPATAFAEIGVHQPRALAYDGATDTLYLAGYGNDEVMAVAEVSQASVHMAWSSKLPATSQGGCAPDGLAVADGELFVHCELERALVRLELDTVAERGVPETHALPAFGASPRSPEAQRGAELFRRGQDPRISTGGFMACASCHPEGRSDGLSWRIEGHNLQTPLLAGRLVGTHPFKWDGKDKDLPTSLSNTVGRLGGSGLSPQQAKDLQAFLESLPRPRPPSVEDPDAIARGQALFESEQTACTACHDGPKLADGLQHDLASNIGSVDTPSLVGLAHTAPYYHDGSARTLRALLTDKGSIHDMGETGHLSEGQVDDLIAYLESL